MYEYWMYANYEGKSVFTECFNSSEEAWEYWDVIMSNMKKLKEEGLVTAPLENFTCEVVEVLKKGAMAHN